MMWMSMNHHYRHYHFQWTAPPRLTPHVLLRCLPAPSIPQATSMALDGAIASCWSWALRRVVVCQKKDRNVKVSVDDAPACIEVLPRPEPHHN